MTLAALVETVDASGRRSAAAVRPGEVWPADESSAIDRFARWHGGVAPAVHVGTYAALMPASPPGPGEQYAFEVDLDACSGCKSCVTACHTLNGLDAGETWRDVGLLHGGTDSFPVIQHVTAACHHCLEPACLIGCPVRAYEKDARTGIVRHLDDQCIGCQYCTLACPYDVPKYNPRLGIVRKCDMCSHRLAVAEAPACAQACPNGAIRINTVRHVDIIESSETGQFLPGAPNPALTLPTTNYKTRRAFPRNLLPADYFAIKPEHAHWPLVFMLVLTQLSVGAFAVVQALEPVTSSGVLAEVTGVHALGAFASGLLALAASLFHLGRPHLAYRAVLGLGTSWLSREILAFGWFALLAACYSAVAWFRPNHESLRGLGLAVVAAGLAGVACSVMIYGTTRRQMWSAGAAGAKFLGTALILGVATTMVLSLVAAAVSPGLGIARVWNEYGHGLVRVLVACASAKLLFESMSFLAMRGPQNSPAKRSALLMIGPLRRACGIRFVSGVVGGVALPALLDRIAEGEVAPNGSLVVGVATLSFLACLMGEIFERYLFFCAVVAVRMPGRLST